MRQTERYVVYQNSSLTLNQKPRVSHASHHVLLNWNRNSDDGCYAHRLDLVPKWDKPVFILL